MDGTAAADYLLRTAGAGLLGAGPAAQLTPRQLKRDMATIGFYRNKASATPPRNFSGNHSSVEDPDVVRRLVPLQTGRRQMRLLASTVPSKPSTRPCAELPQTAAQYARGGPVLAPRQRPAADDLRDPRLHGGPLLAQPPVPRAALVLRPGLRHPAVHPAPPRQTPVAPVAVQRPRPVRHGLSHLNESMAHAVHDFRIFMDYLEGRGVSRIGVTGISLGAIPQPCWRPWRTGCTFHSQRAGGQPARPGAGWYPMNLAIRAC